MTSVASRTAPLSVASVVSAACVAVRQLDPSHHHLTPGCPFHQLTGRWCPLCGAVRGMHHALHGDVTGALGSNALLAVIVPGAVVGWVWWMLHASGRNRGRIDPRWTRVATVIGLVVTIGFTVLRNTGTGASLAP